MGLDLRTIGDRWVDADPDRVALIDPDGEWTYAELGAVVRAAAARLYAAGVRSGDRVPVVDAPSRLALVAILAALRLGAAAAPMNPRLTADEVAILVGLAGTGKVGVAGAAYGDRLAGLDMTVLSTELLDPADDPLAAVPDPATVTPGPDGVVLFTSGTTGLPKPVPVPWPTMHDRLAPYADPPARQVRMLCVPIHHVGGLLGAIVCFVGGHTLVIQPRFEAGEWLRLVEKHRVQLTFIVPTMLARIVDHPALPGTDLSSLETVTYGASPMTDDLIARLTEAMPGVGLVNTFGQTETLGGITLSTPADAVHPVRRTSVGKVLPGVEIRIVSPGTEDEVPAGAVGELLVRSGQNVVEGWLRTGDLVRVDDEGYMYPEGRLSDTINRGGEKFGPIEVETALRAHPEVLDCAVAGVPDPELNERVGAVVVLRNPTSVTDLQLWCTERIARYKAPEFVVVVDDVPLTDMGKVDRKAVVRLVKGD